jgi:hypothetical protein
VSWPGFISNRSANCLREPKLRHAQDRRFSACRVMRKCTFDQNTPEASRLRSRPKNSGLLAFHPPNTLAGELIQPRDIDAPQAHRIAWRVGRTSIRLPGPPQLQFLIPRDMEKIRSWLIGAICASAVIYGVWQIHLDERIRSGPVESVPVQLEFNGPDSDTAQARPFSVGNYTLTPRATYTIEAKILSKTRYRFAANSDLMPWDFALGWGPMSHEEVLAKLRISQSDRFYFYSWTGAPPIPADQMISTASNNHLIPSSGAVLRTLNNARAGQAIRISGRLVDFTTAAGGHAHTSLTRTDTGAGACEIIYVESAEVLAD